MAKNDQFLSSATAPFQPQPAALSKRGFWPPTAIAKEGAYKGPCQFFQGTHSSSAVPMVKMSDSELTAENRQLLPSHFALPTDDFPVILEAINPVKNPDFFEWGQAAREPIDVALQTSPAVLVRGMTLEEPADFRRFLDGVGYPQAPYLASFIARGMKDGVYDATANPPEFFLYPHNENVFYDSEMVTPKIIFAMLLPATGGGGECTLLDNAKATLSVGAEIIDQFQQHSGVRYSRWYLGNEQKRDMLKSLAGTEMAKGLKVMSTWENMVDKDNALEGDKRKAAAEAYFKELKLTVTWDGFGGLHANNVLPATIANPKTGEPQWFNFAYSKGFGDFFKVTYGDGTPIEEEVRQAILVRSLAETVAFPYQKGDMIIMNNMLCGHGRTPFDGKRHLRVEMAT